jgi:hypothetical protein
MCNAIHNINDLPRVIVEIRGGVVQAIYSSEPINVSVLDRDNWEAEEDPAERDYFAALERECETLPEVL